MTREANPRDYRSGRLHAQRENPGAVAVDLAVDLVRAGPRPPALRLSFFTAIRADEWQRWADAHPLSAVVLSQSLAPFTRDLRVMYQIEPNQILPNPFQP